MNLTEELCSITGRTANRLSKKRKKSGEYFLRVKRSQEKSLADKILRELSNKLKKHAGSTDVRRYEVLQMRDVQIPLGKKFNSRDLKGAGRIVFAGCKNLGLNVRVEDSEYDDGMTGVTCAGIWVHW